MDGVSPSVEITQDAEDADIRAAALIAVHLREALEQRGRAALAVSGGSTAPPMLASLAQHELAWDSVDVYQVDERVAPDGDEARNANALADFPGTHHLMPVTAPDLEDAARRYASELPSRFDVVHLGMGPDGHTASWPPGDPVIDRTDPVELSQEYQGHLRMTLTPPVVNAATARVVLIVGDDKSAAVAQWIDGDADLPISRVTPAGTTVVLDPAAGADLTRD